MPLSKPNNTVLHRISFSTKERELLEEFMQAKTAETLSSAVNKAVFPVVVLGLGGIAYIIGDGIYDYATKHGDKISAVGTIATEESTGFVFPTLKPAWAGFKKLFS